MAEIVIKLANGELAGKTLQGITKEIRAARLEAEKATVGTQDWVKAHDRLDKATGMLSSYKKEQAALTSGSDALKKSFMGVLNQIPGFSSLSGIVTQATSGVGGLTSGFGLLKGAIISTGIGALVIAIVSLVSWFAKTETGANILSGAFKAMGAVIDTLMGRLWNIGNTLKELFSNPIEFFKNLGKDIAGAAKEGYELVQVFDDIEDRQRDMAVKAKETDIEIDRLILQAKNVGKTYDERVAILNKVDQLTRESYQSQLALSKEYLDAVQREIDGEMKRQGVNEMTDEQADKLKEAKLAYLDLVAQETQIEEKVANFRERIFEKDAKAQEKAAAAKEKEQATIDKWNEEWEQKQQQQDAIKDRRAQADLDRESNKVKKIMALTAQYLADRAKAEKQNADEIQAIEDAKQKMQAQSLAVFNEGTASIISLLGADAAARKKNAQEIKTFEKGRVVVNGIAEISAIAKTFAELGPVGQILAAFRIAFSAARTFAAIRSIDAQKFALGGIPEGVLNGPSHAEGGIPLIAEGQEIILTKGVYRSPWLRAMASAINVAGGGRQFAMGGPTNPFDSGSGSLTSSAAAPGSSDPFAALGRLEAKFELYAAKVDSWSRNLKVVNNLQETQSGLNTLNTLSSESNI